MRSLLFVLLPLSLTAALPDTIQTTAGKVSGVVKDGVRVFRGLPYAAPPTGNLRWRAPQPLDRWTGVRKTERFSANCIQAIADSKDPWTSEFLAHGQTSEDCLYLNVWTDAHSQRDKRPVFVWVHGGAFNEGSGSIAAYDGENLARRGLVVVTMNYRVGALGFLAHPELTAESPHASSGNYGLLDQLAALEWVRANIAAFGGDPARVTLAGQSAGASSVHALATSPLAAGLFQRMIAQSGSRPASARKPLSVAEQEGVKFAAARGGATLAELRNIPAEDIRKAGGRFGPVDDEWLLRAATAERDIPALTGMVWDEGSSGANYLASDMQSQRTKTMAAMLEWAKLRSKDARSNAFLYVFDHPEPGPNSARYRVFHTSEVPYVFDSLAMCDRPWKEDDRRIASMMAGYWMNFAATGDPNGKGLPPWPAFHVSRREAMELGDRNAPLTIP